MRTLPDIPAKLAKTKRPISFVCVKYSNEFYHNFATSPCTNDDLNELIVIDNSNNLFFSAFGQAVNTGIARAKNDLIVIVHEDVFLPDDWQSMLEQSLQKLERDNINWLVAGISGGDYNKQIHGYINEPELSYNSWSTRQNTQQNYMKVDFLHSPLIVLKKSISPLPDSALPRHHHVGIDLTMSANKANSGAYLLNAPILHQYKNEIGNIITCKADSLKLQKKEQLGYLAARVCADEHLIQKWPELDKSLLDFEQPGPFTHARTPVPRNCIEKLSTPQTKILSSPIILLAKGGGGSRLVATLANDLDIFIGNDVNPTGDSREMARSVYRAFFRQHWGSDIKNNTVNESDLRMSAYDMLEQAEWPKVWGFKVPESLFILPIINSVFPDARYVFMQRDPLSTSLRGTHMTADYDNPIGQIALGLAYDSVKRERKKILTDNKAVRLAYTTLHQLTKVMHFKKSVHKQYWLSLRFEDLISAPLTTLDQFSSFTGQQSKTTTIINTIDEKRAAIEYAEHSTETIIKVESILRPIRTKLGYD